MKTPEKSTYNKEEIQLLLPQKEPFVLVDALFFCNDTRAITGFQIPEKHNLVEDNILTEAGVLENMAQSIALKSAHLIQKEKPRPPKIGYLAGIKNAKIDSLPKTTQKITTHIKLMYELGPLKRYQAEIKNAQNQQLATAEITTTLAEE